MENIKVAIFMQQCIETKEHDKKLGTQANNNSKKKELQII